uniref:ATP synthase subunit a n=1 Tax=Dendrocerus sp. ZJUH_2016009 TaxID=2491154 RepID=A0A3S8V0G7_9HYME|nr:ATP synthase F0 subunit 6 [Dendrocerus sp. ZJUH_2016009]
MAPNLFSIFDPSSSQTMALNWSSSMFMFLFIPVMMWITPSRMIIPFNMISFYLNNEFKIILNYYSSKNIIMFLSMMIFIMLNNFISLFPYIFTSTAHLNVSLAMSLPLWLSFMLFGWINNTNNMFNHLVPQGTPPILMPFMVIIESISNLIRPMTLAVRLSANMIAGHLLLTLLSSSSIKVSYLILLFILLSQISLIILEMSVSLIQAYVFTILSTLYCSEVK